MTYRWASAETPPKSGTYVIAYTDDGMCFAFYLSADDEYLDMAPGWYEVHDGEDFEIDPTHWIELPPIPGTGEDK